MTGSSDNREYLFLDEFHIEGFRGLQAVTLNDLARFNLLVGRNNSGKTSILEAIAIFSSPLDMVEWASIARSREVRSIGLSGETLSSIEAVRWMFPHMAALGRDDEEHDPISMSARGRVPMRRLVAKCGRLHGIPPEDARQRGFLGREREKSSASYDDLTEDEGWLISVEYVDEAEGLFSLPSEAYFPLWSSLGVRYAPRVKGRRPVVELLTPYAHRNQALNLQLLTRTILDDTKGSVRELLSSFDENILDVEIIATADGRRPAIAVRHKINGTVPISVLGDGIRRALSIALSVRKARNGILLVDEIEAALHVSALDRLYPWLIESCERYNVQLIATTHSLEAIDAIAKMSDWDHVDVAAFHLADRPHESEPRRYSGRMLRRLVHDQGLDVR
jgi:energy-coupling factor transporter ATP-binding protein EcfA2